MENSEVWINREGGNNSDGDIKEQNNASYDTNTLFSIRIEKIGSKHYACFYRDNVKLNVSGHSGDTNRSIEADTGMDDWKLRVKVNTYLANTTVSIKDFRYIYKNRTYNINYNIESDEKLSVGDYVNITDTNLPVLDNKLHKVTNISTSVNSITADTQIDTIRIKTNASSTVSSGIINTNYGKVTVDNKGTKEIVLNMLDKSISSGNHHLYISWMYEFQNSSPNDQLLKVYYKTSPYNNENSVSDGILYRTIYQTSSNTSNNTTTEPLFIKVPDGQIYYIRITRTSESTYEWLNLSQDSTDVNKIKKEDIKIDYVEPFVVNKTTTSSTSSKYEEKKVSFRSSENISIKSIASSSNVIKINNSIEELVNIDGITEENVNNHGTSVIRIFHGKRFTKIGRIHSWSIKINNYYRDYHSDKLKYVTPLIFESVGTRYDLPKYTLRGVGKSYYINRTGVIKDIPFDLQVGSDEIKSNYTIGFTLRHLVWDNTTSTYTTNENTKDEAGICYYLPTGHNTNEGELRWIYTEIDETKINDFFGSSSNKGGIGLTISRANDNGDLKNIVDTSISVASPNVVSYLMSAKVIESSFNEITRVGKDLLQSSLFNSTIGGLYISAKTVALKKGKLKTWNGYISSANKYITPVILTKDYEGIKSEYRIKGIGTSYTKSTTGLTGNIDFGLQVGYDTVDVGDTFGFLDRHIVWDSSSSQFTTNTPYSGSIGYNEIAVNIGSNEWANVTNSIGKYITNNVILDTKFGNNISFKFDETYKDKVSSIQQNVIRLGGTSPTSYDAYIRGSDKITKYSNIIGIRFKFNAILDTVVGLSPKNFTYHSVGYESNELAIGIYGGSPANITYSIGDTVTNVTSGISGIKSEDILTLKLNEDRTKILVLKNDRVLDTPFEYPPSQTLDQLFGVNWELFPDLMSRDDNYILDLEYVTDIRLQNQNYINYPLTHRPITNYIISNHDKGTKIISTRSGSQTWLSRLYSSSYLTPDGDIIGFKFKSVAIAYSVLGLDDINNNYDNANPITDWSDNLSKYRIHPGTAYNKVQLFVENAGTDAGSTELTATGFPNNNDHNTTNFYEVRLLKNPSTGKHNFNFYINSVLKVTRSTTIETDFGRDDWKLRFIFFDYDSTAGIKEFQWVYKNGQDYTSKNILNPYTYDINFNIESEEKTEVGDYVKITNSNSTALDNKFHKITNISTVVNSVTANTVTDTITINTNANSTVSSGNIIPHYEKVTVDNKGSAEVVLNMLDKVLSTGDHHLFISWMSEYQNSSPNDQLLKVYYKTTAYTNETSVSDGTLYKTIYQTSSNTSNNTTTEPLFFRVPDSQSYYIRITRTSESTYEWLNSGQDLTGVNKIKNEDISIDYITPTVSNARSSSIFENNTKVKVIDADGDRYIKFETDGIEKMKIENDKISIFNNVELLSSGDVALKIKADTDNVDENDNALLVLSQDNDTVKMEMGGVGSLGEIYTDSLANAQYIMAYTTSSNTDIKPSLQFVTKDGSNPLTSRMTILNDGKIGLGTNNPGTVFEIKDSQPYITLRNSEIENTEGGCESKIIFEDHGGNRLAQIQGSHDGTADDTKGNLIFSTSNGIVVNEVMNINNDGNIRIGKTTNDSANVSGRLAIVSNNSTTTDLEFRTDDITLSSKDYPTAKIESGFTSTSWNTAYLKFRTHASNAVGFTDDMIIRGGNVGIGTNDPKSLLEIKGSSPKLILRDNASNTPSIEFIRGTGSTTFGVDATQDWKIKSEYGNLIFFTQSTSEQSAGGTSGADILKLNWNERNYM